MVLVHIGEGFGYSVVLLVGNLPAAEVVVSGYLSGGEVLLVVPVDVEMVCPPSFFSTRLRLSIATIRMGLGRIGNFEG